MAWTKAAALALGALTMAGGAVKAADLPQVPAAEVQKLGWYLHVGAAGLLMNESASISVGGAPVPGASVSIRRQITVAAELGYFVLPNVAVSFTGGYPPVAHIDGAGSLAGIGRLGDVRAGPMALTAHYHFTNFGPFQPYLGAGPAFMFVFHNNDGLMTDLKVHNNAGVALQGGFDMMMNRHWGVFFDVKKVFLRTEATGLFAGAPAKANVTLDPLVVHGGITYRF